MVDSNTVVFFLNVLCFFTIVVLMGCLFVVVLIFHFDFITDFLPGDDAARAGHFFPNLEALAGDDGTGTFWPEMISSLEMIKAWVIFV